MSANNNNNHHQSNDANNGNKDKHDEDKNDNDDEKNEEKKKEKDNYRPSFVIRTSEPSVIIADYVIADSSCNTNNNNDRVLLTTGIEKTNLVTTTATVAIAATSPTSTQQEVLSTNFIQSEYYHPSSQNSFPSTAISSGRPSRTTTTTTRTTAAAAATTTETATPGAHRVRGLMYTQGVISSSREEEKIEEGTEAIDVPAVHVEAYSVAEEVEKDVSCSCKCCSCSIECNNLPAKHIKCALLALVFLVGLVTIPVSIILSSTLRGPLSSSPPPMLDQCGENLTITVDGQKRVLGPQQNYSVPFLDVSNGKSIVCGNQKNELRLISNVTTSYTFPYRVVNKTYIEYDWYVSNEQTTLGSLICLDIDEIIDPQRCFLATNIDFVLYDDKNKNDTTITTTNNKSNTTNNSSTTRKDTVRYIIPIGTYFVGIVNVLAFVSAAQTGSNNSTVMISNIKIKS